MESRHGGRESLRCDADGRVHGVDGLRVADIMMRYNIGVEVHQCIVLKGLDSSYFAPQASQARDSAR